MLCDESAGPRQKQREGKRPRSDSVEDYKENLESTVFQQKKKKPQKSLNLKNQEISLDCFNSEIRSP